MSDDEVDAAREEHARIPQFTDGTNEVYCRRCSRLTDGGAHCPSCVQEMRDEAAATERWGRR